MIRRAMALLALLVSTSSFSETVLMINVEISTPSCTVNDNKLIQIEFDDVIIDRIDGENYETKIPYTLKCKSGTKNLRIRFTGAPAGDGFRYNTLLTSVDGLGLELKIQKLAYPFDVWYPFTWPTLPVLTATPVKRSGAELKVGDFYAAAVLELGYL